MSGIKLSLARKLRGLSQTQLASSVNVSQRAISKYEKEGKGLSESKLQEIATVLDFEPDFFNGEEIELPLDSAISFRARSKISAKKRDQATSICAFGTLLSDWMESEYVLPAPDIPDLSNYDPETAARTLRNIWGLGECPISDMISLLESHGVRVFSVSEASSDIDAYSFWDETRNRPFVFLTISKSGERRRMDSAHELGHLVLHRKADLVSKDSRNIEKQADLFASAFLMPDCGFRADLPSVLSLTGIMKIKKYWKVSAFAVAVRAHSLGVLSDWLYHDLCINMGKLGMRTTEPDSIAPERSQVADTILSFVKKDYGDIRMLAKILHIPYSIIMDLTFHPKIEVISIHTNRQRQNSTNRLSSEAFRIISNHSH